MHTTITKKEDMLEYIYSAVLEHMHHLLHSSVSELSLSVVGL